MDFRLIHLAGIEPHDGPPLELAPPLATIAFADAVDDANGVSYGDDLDVGDLAEKLKLVNRYR